MRALDSEILCPARSLACRTITDRQMTLEQQPRMMCPGRAGLRTARQPSRVPQSAPVQAASARPQENAIVGYPSLPTVVLLLFCGWILFNYLQVGFRIPVLGVWRVELWYGIALALIALAQGRSLSSPLTPLTVALFVCMAIQVPLSHDPTTSTRVFVDHVLKFAIVSVFIVAFVKGPREVKWFLAAFLLACLKMGEEGFLGTITGSLVWQNQGVMRLHGTTPIYEHPNSFSGMALGTLPFAFYLFPVCRRPLKAALLILAVFSCTIVLFSGSRTAYIGSIGFIAFIILKSRRPIRTFAVVAILAAVTLPMVPADYVGRFDSIFTQEDKEGESTELRIQTLEDAWQVFTTHPFGIGVGAFPAVRKQMFGRLQDTHNLYLEVATNLGIQGFVVFMLFVLGMLTLLARLGRQFDEQLAAFGAPSRDPKVADPSIRAHYADLRLFKQTAIAVQGFLMVRLFLGLFGMDLYEIYWWFAMGLTIALYKLEPIAALRTQALAAAAAVRPAPSAAVSFRGRLAARGVTA